ncbi:MAG TPA: ParA family protein [Ktedonosporobacter sp.]|nr:ParA family protein [Ktedonosporobacter sp.]
MALKLVVALPKGGVGKTLLVRNLAEAVVRWYAARGELAKVLMVELDPQGNLTQGCGLRPRRMRHTIYTEMSELVRTFKANVRNAIVSISDTVDLIPANILLNYASEEFASAVQKETLLQRLLRPIEADYEVIIVDTQPLLGFLVNNALKWADQVVIPLQAESDAIESTALLLEHLKRLDTMEFNPQLAIAGLLFTQIRAQTVLHRNAMEFAHQSFGPYVHFFDAWVPESVVYPEARAQQLSIYQYRPDSKFAQVYTDIACEILEDQKRVLVSAMKLEEGFLDKIFEGVDTIDQDAPLGEGVGNG